MLQTRDTSKLLRERVLKELEKDSMVHSFSAAAQKLMDLTRQQDVPMSEIADVVRTEAGLAAKVLKAANSVVFGGSKIRNIDEALIRIGMDEIRSMALTLGVMDRVAHLKVKVDWNLYWMHCLLTARVTHLFATAYRPTGGKEYLAGLMHDIGKLFLEHHFPQEFETILLRAQERGCGMYEVECQLYDIQHPEVGSLLCDKWGLDPEISRSIRFHHNPFSEENVDPMNPQEEKLLATCISVADTVANMCKANIQGGKRFKDLNLENVPEWVALQQYPTFQIIDINLENEIVKAQETVNAFLGNT